MDPFFRSQRCEEAMDPMLYQPDYEATAIGLAEQYRFCIADPSASDALGECSLWQSNRWSPSSTRFIDGAAEEEQIDPSNSIRKRFDAQDFPRDLIIEFEANDALRRALYTAFTFSSVEESVRESTQLPLAKMFTTVQLSPVINPRNQTLE
jgi:hypothetical protein